MAGRIVRKRGSVEYRIEFSLSDDYIDVVYEPETADSYANIELSDVTVQVAEFDGLIESLIKIRDDIKNMIANDAESAIGGQGTALVK